MKSLKKAGNADSARKSKLSKAIFETLEYRRMLTAIPRVIDTIVIRDDGSIRSSAASSIDGPRAFPFAGSASDEVTAPDGKEIVAGTSGGDFALARFTTSGQLDSSFSGDGKLTTDFGSSSDQAYSVTVMPDGKIMVWVRSSAQMMAGASR